jgi:hypothetical protein
MSDFSETLRLQDLKGFIAIDQLARNLHISQVMEKISDPWLWMPLFAAISTIFLVSPLPRRAHLWIPFFSLACWFVAIQLSDLLSSYLFCQPSPSAWLALAGNTSIPDHPYSMPDWFCASLSGYMTFAMVLLPIGRKWHRWAAWWALVPLAVFARICAAEAFPSHAFLGLVVGQLVAVLFLVFYRNFRIVVLHEPAA